MRRIIVMGCLGLGLLAVLMLAATRPLTSAQAGQAAQTTDTAAVARAMVAELNAWRLDEGLWPLKPNDTLTAMAQAQAEYLASLPRFPDDFHAGRRGESPPERAITVPYNWPDYGRAERVAIGEIAHVGSGAGACVRYWQGSDIHSRTVRNSAYREIGVGVVSHEYGYIFIVVFGARPNVLPVLVDPVENMLYLSNENYTWAPSGDGWIHEAGQVRLFDAEGRPLSQDWMTWETAMPLPENAGDHVYAAFTDGDLQVLSPVDLSADRVLLPHTLALFDGAAVASAPPTATPVPPSATRVPAATAETASTAVAAVPTPTFVPSPTLPPVTEPDVQVVYDDRSLAVINVSGDAADLSSLSLRHPDGELAITAWQNQWLAASLNAFPAGDCLQVWGWNESSDPAKPQDCGTQRGIITINPDRLFWSFTTFTVYWHDQPLTACEVGAGECAFALPD